jgi:hypothetical protein
MESRRWGPGEGISLSVGRKSGIHSTGFAAIRVTAASQSLEGPRLLLISPRSLHPLLRWSLHSPAPNRATARSSSRHRLSPRISNLLSVSSCRRRPFSVRRVKTFVLRRPCGRTRGIACCVRSRGLVIRAGNRNVRSPIIPMTSGPPALRPGRRRWLEKRAARERGLMAGAAKAVPCRGRRPCCWRPPAATSEIPEAVRF